MIRIADDLTILAGRQGDGGLLSMWPVAEARPRVIGAGTAAGWFDGDTAHGTGHGGATGWTLLEARRATGWAVVPRDPDFAANAAFSGGRRWIASRSPAGDRIACRGTIPAEYEQDWAAHDCGPDGSIVLSYQDGITKAALWASGAIEHLQTGDLRAGAGYLLGVEGDVVRVRYPGGAFEEPAQLPGVKYWPTFIGPDYLGYLSPAYGGFVVHGRGDASLGYQWPGSEYFFAAGAVGQGRALLTWATREGAQPDDLVRISLALGVGMRPLAPVAVTLPSATHPCAIFTGAADEATRLTWWNDPQQTDPRNRAMYFEYNPARGGQFEEELRVGLPRCRALGLPAAMHQDGAGYPRLFEDDMARRCAAAGVRFVPFVRIYPEVIGGTLEAEGATLERADRVVRDLQTRHRYVGTWLAAYSPIGASGRFDYWPAERVRSLLLAGWDLARSRRLDFISFFDDSHPGQSPELKAIAKSATTSRALPWPLDPVVTPVPTPITPITPIPTPIPTPPAPPEEEDDDEMPKALITTEEREPLLAIAGRIAATVYGIPQAEATQGVRQASDALRKFGIDGTPTDWVLLSRAREGGATPDEVEAFAKTARDLRAKR